MINERLLIETLQHGLPLVSHPYAEIAKQINASENEVIEHIKQMQNRGDIKRMGIVVRHRQLGYTANAMVVWDVPDESVDSIGECFGRFDFVTLSYRRPRRLPDWPYNLFCMIHGQDREDVLLNLQRLIDNCETQQLNHSVLFSNRCFKQRGAVYIHNNKVKESA